MPRYEVRIQGGGGVDVITVCADSPEMAAESASSWLDHTNRTGGRSEASPIEGGCLPATWGYPVRALKASGAIRESITDASQLTAPAWPPDIETRTVTQYLICTCARRCSVGSIRLPATTWGRFRCLDPTRIGVSSCFLRSREGTSAVPRRLTNWSYAPQT